MLKGDQPCERRRERLDYDGAVSKATYTGRRSSGSPIHRFRRRRSRSTKKRAILPLPDPSRPVPCSSRAAKDKKTKERVRSIGIVEGISVRGGAAPRDVHGRCASERTPRGHDSRQDRALLEALR